MEQLVRQKLIFNITVLKKKWRKKKKIGGFDNV